MLGDEKRLDPGDLFHTFNVDALVPPNHMLRKIDAVLDTSWVRKEVAELYSDRGRPSWDPEVIIRMILLGYLYDLSEVRLVDELRMHMGYRWFCHLQPSDPVPDRTTLVKLRNEKWKSDIWQKLLAKTIQQCQEAGLVSGRHVSIDGTKIKANAAWGSLAYLGNFCIDTKSRVVLGAEASPGRTSGEWTAGASMLDFVKTALGTMPKIVSADKGYGVARFYAEMERRGIVSHIPPRNSPSEVRIPKSRLLGMKVVAFDRAKPLIKKRYGLRARNKAHRIKNTTGFRISRLLRLRVEHKIGEAKECHGLRRARHRGLQEMDNQVKITAAIMNLKVLARYLGRGPRACAARSSVVLCYFDLCEGSLTRILIEFLFPNACSRKKRQLQFGYSSQGF